MKGVSVSDVIGVGGVILILFLFFFYILPKTFSFVIENLSSSSSINVAKQLAALISVSASSYSTQIEFLVREEVKYKVEVNGRVIKIIPKFKTTYAEKSSARESFLVDLINYVQDDVNRFIVLKERVGDGYVYKLQ